MEDPPYSTPEQGELLTSIEMLINTEVPRMDYPDFKPTEPPANFRYELPGGRREGGLQIVGQENAAAPPVDAPKVSRIEASMNPGMPKADEAKFPGGIVPTKMPPKRLIRGIKSSRR